MTRVMYWNPWYVFLYGAVFSLIMLVAGAYFYKGKQKEDINEKLVLYGFACWTFMQGFRLIFLVGGGMQIRGTYENHILYVKQPYPTYSPNIFWFFELLNALFFIISYIIFFYTFERVVKRSRYFLTISGIALLIFHLIFWIFIPLEISSLIFYNFTMQFFGLTLLIIIIIYTRISSLEGKTVAAFFYLWIPLVVLGEIFSIIRFFYLSAMIIAPLLSAVGVIMMLIPLVINPKYLSRSLLYWRISGVSIAILYLCMWSLFFFIYEIPDYSYKIIILQGLMIYGIIFVVMYLFIDISIRYEKPLKEKEEAKGFGAFVRPQRITEEEVSVSKEKKICLVCKGKTSRLTYICPECESIYCVKCSNTMSDLENACWVCETPFDESKPVKPYKEKEQEVAVEEKVKNGKIL